MESQKSEVSKVPYRIRHVYPWQNPAGGIEKDVVEFQELLPYQISVGMKESFKEPDIEAIRREQDLVEAAKTAAIQRAEPREGIVDIEELRKYRKECWDRGGYLQPEVIQ